MISNSLFFASTIAQVKTVVTTAPKPSFFHYFGEPMTEEEEAEEEENEDEEAPRIKLSQEEDYDIGTCVLRLPVLRLRLPVSVIRTAGGVPISGALSLHQACHCFSWMCWSNFLFRVRL